MNKFTKLILTTAVFATSGFATTIAELQNGGEVKSGATIDFQGQTLTLAENASIDVYGDLTGTGTINCSGTGQVNVYGNAYKEDAMNRDDILTAAGLSDLTVHTLDESNKGSIAETITVEPSSALNKTNSDLASYASGIDETHLVYVANSDGSDTKCVGKTGSALEIKASLANADASISGLMPSALVVENKLKFSGDNSGFTGKTVTIGTTETPAEVEYASAKSAFQADTTVENDSKLVISDANDINLSKNLVINGTKKVLKADNSIELENSHGTLNVKGKLVLENGAKLTLGKAYEEVNAEHTYDYPQVMTWPAGTFDTPMTTSDGTDGWTSGTIHDSVFSYTKSADGIYTRTHQYPIDSTGKALSSFPLTITNAEFDYMKNINGIVKYENHKYIFNGTATNTYEGLNISINKSDFDLRVEGNSTTGFYTANNNIWQGIDSRIVAAIFGTYQGH
ncbi:MAG: hypothetical protein Q4E61_02425 [Alphaproteobacteria bacterium]|nr:hypothetical protein [Alphaproteobacteria bacterium]